MIDEIICELDFDKIKDKKILYQKDIKESLKSFTPGKWCYFVFKNRKKNIFKKLAFINPIVSQGPQVRFLETKDCFSSEIECLETLISKALAKRELFYPNIKSKRLIFGESDDLPGLIVDQYENCALIQINSAGIDQFRDNVSLILKKLIKTPIYFLNNLEYRKNENLPVYDKEKLPEKLFISENNLLFEIPSIVIQKIGFYFDHRENRNKLFNFLQKVDTSFVRNTLDLFCYTGAWGLNALKSGVSQVDFVDQGNFKDVIQNNLDKNKYSNKGTFFREDVFKFLDKTDKKYQLIISDPPAFSKNRKNKKSALLGYQKLFDKIMQVADKKCFWALGSCTHGISLEDLSLLAITRSKKYNKKLQLLDIGVQSMDHPFSSLNDENFYIKYILYYIQERR